MRATPQYSFPKTHLTTFKGIILPKVEDWMNEKI